MKKWRWMPEKTDLCFGILLLAGAAIYLLRIPQGIVELDERFFLTLPFRLVQGDCLLVDEWHVGQLIGFLLYPIMKLYLAAAGSTEGIYLAFRYIYLVVLSAAVVISYVMLRRKDRKLAVVCCTMVYLFTPNCVKVLSYNSMGLMSVWLFVVLALTETHHFKSRYAALGVLLAAIVLCNPFMVLLYLLYTAASLWKREKDGFFGIRAWIWVTVGAGAIFLVFVSFLLSRATIPELLQNLWYCTWDPAHESRGLMDYLQSIFWFVNWFKWFFIPFAGMFLAAVFCPRWRKLMYMGLMALSMVLWILLVVFKGPGIGKHAIMLPLTLLGGTAFLFTREKQWDLFLKGWLVGILYAGCMNLASDQGIYVICNACTISSAVSLFFIQRYFKENEGIPGRNCWFAALIVIQLAAEAYINLSFVYGEGALSSLTHQINAGPMKGIWTSEESGEIYDINYENIRSLGDVKGRNIMFFNYFSCGYFMVPEARNASFSGWMIEFKTLDDARIQAYYELHPEKIPEIIYIDTYAVIDWTEEELKTWCEENHYRKQDFKEGGSALFLQQ